jgi:hypothetical protein
MASGYAVGFRRCQHFRKGGGDKAPVPGKAEAKARRYAPFFKNVDESDAWSARSLTGFRPKSGAAGAASTKMPDKILGEPEPYRHPDRHIPTGAAFSSRDLKR